jgi:hypothetical protein
LTQVADEKYSLTSLGTLLYLKVQFTPLLDFTSLKIFRREVAGWQLVDHASSQANISLSDQ